MKSFLIQENLEAMAENVMVGTVRMGLSTIWRRMSARSAIPSVKPVLGSS
jgi:hypothetical protein